MNKAIQTIIVAIGVFMTTHSSALTKEESEVLNAAKEKIRLSIEGKFDSLEKLLDDNLKLIHVTGQEVSKKEWLDDMRTKKYIYHKVDIREATAVVEGDKAKVTGKAQYTVTIYGSKGTYNLAYIETYQKKDKNWKLVRGEARFID